jgi:acyl dehydratase
VYSLVLGMSVPDVSGAAIANLEVETLQHKHPTFHGDTIYAETKVLDKKESSSKPDRGIVTVETKAFNQDGKEVCFFRRRVMVWKREALPGAPGRTTPWIRGARAERRLHAAAVRPPRVGRCGSA